MIYRSAISFVLATICGIATTGAEPSWRIRLDPQSPLNADTNWAAATNDTPDVRADYPFRLRIELELSNEKSEPLPGVILQYRRNGDEDWTEVGAYDFPYPKGEEPRSPRVSVVSTYAYSHGAPTSDLLSGSEAKFVGGHGVNLAAAASPWSESSGHLEFEWPLVIRRWVDKAESNEEGDIFDFRLAKATGEALPGSPVSSVRLTVQPQHLGGTFVETPGRIGPWEVDNGDLYFIMEPAESSNLFMMVKSSDGGRSWHEVDSINRPETDDLEAVDGRLVGDTIQIIHQITEAAYRHEFRPSTHPQNPDTWATTDELIAKSESISQGASLVVRGDGSIVAFYVGESLRYSVSSTTGQWGPSHIVPNSDEPFLASPQAILGKNDTVHFVYYGGSGTLWHRSLTPDNVISSPIQIATDVGTDEEAYGSALPLVYLEETDTLVIAYQLEDLRLYERRITGGENLSEAVQITQRTVVREAADSQQPGADLVKVGDDLIVFYIDDETGEIYSKHYNGSSWGDAQLRVPNVTANWIRATSSKRANAESLIRFIYDAGSGGGAGMNRYGEFKLEID